MPPKAITTPESTDTDITLLFKHTSHTILLLVPPNESFTSILSTLLEVLRERYPNGLSRMPSPLPATTPSMTTLSSTAPALTESKIPLPDSIQAVALGVPIDVFEPQKGWSELGLRLGDSPKSLGVKDGGVVAFRFLNRDEDEDDDGEFQVNWPSFEEMYPDAVEDMDAEERTLGGDGEEGKFDDEEEL